MSEPHVIDCLGQPCPVPVIELARAIAGVPIGSDVVVLSDDPAAASDIAAWCRMRGHTLEEAAGTSYRVRRVS
ncbi:MAG: SirA-like protein [Frankiales bacterium]|nr:SirA-like protein [Frankiales bacterium]